MAVLCWDERMAWLDMRRSERDPLHTLPPGSFRVSHLHHGRAQPAPAI
jgi:hypothetical protein